MIPCYGIERSRRVPPDLRVHGDPPVNAREIQRRQKPAVTPDRRQRLLRVLRLPLRPVDDDPRHPSENIEICHVSPPYPSMNALRST